VTARPNAELAYRVLDYVTEHPEQFLVAEIFGPRPEQVLFIRQDGTSVDVTPEPDEDDVPPNAGSAS
jgi:hypothetical protein